MSDTGSGVSYEAAVSALEANLWDMWAAFGRGEHCTLVDTPDLLRFETPIPYIPYNSVMRSRFDAAHVDRRLDEVLRAYQERHVPLMWVVHPSATPTDLGERLKARGLVEAEICPGMVAAIDQLPLGGGTGGVVVERLDVEARDEFFELVAWRYSLPGAAGATLLSIMRERRFGEVDCPTQAWVVRWEGSIVSKVILHLTGDVAGVYGVATRPEARGQGLAERLTSTALAYAQRQGARLAILHSTPRARPLYERLGFARVADFRLYSTPGTLHL